MPPTDSHSQHLIRQLLQHFTTHPSHAIALIFGFIGLYILVTVVRRRSAVLRLGSFAPSLPSYLPIGLDIVFRSVRHTLRNDDLTFWSWMYAQSPHKGSPTVEANIGGQRYIFTADPDNIKAILATQFHEYGKGEAFRNDWKLFLGNGVFNTDGEVWHRNRALLRPHLTKDRISDLDLFETHVERLMARFGDSGEKIDVAELFYQFTLDVATEFLLGESVGHLDNPEAHFAMAFAEIQKFQTIVTRLGPFAALMPKTSLKKNIKRLDEFVDPFIDGILASDAKALEHDHSFLYTLADGGLRDRQMIRDQLVNVLLAGRDSLAGTLSFAFLELSRHPGVLQKLRAEIISKLGTEKRPTYQDLKDLTYLKHTLNEVLRLYPALPYNIRWSSCDTTLPTGGGPDGKRPIGIPRNTPVAYSTLYLHMREDLYPSDSPHPHEFNPDRWRDWTPKSWQYIPWNGGPRICLGQQFALTEMSYTIIRILQRYSSIDCYSPDLGGPRYKSEVVISPVDGVKVGFRSK